MCVCYACIITVFQRHSDIVTWSMSAFRPFLVFLFIPYYKLKEEVLPPISRCFFVAYHKHVYVSKLNSVSLKRSYLFVFSSHLSNIQYLNKQCDILNNICKHNCILFLVFSKVKWSKHFFRTVFDKVWEDKTKCL